MLRGRMEWQPFAKVCASKAHEHTTRGAAQHLVDIELAEWITELVVTVNRKGKVKETRRPVPAIRRVRGKRWKKTMCRDGYESVATMQLVPGG
jgi:hypothetical protein